MTSMIMWMIGIAASVSALVLTAALKQFWPHLGVAALVSLLVALAAFWETRDEHARTSEVSGALGINLRHMGLVWAWGALTIFVTYGFKILEWREWWHFFIAFVVLAGLSLFLSATLRKDAEGATVDETMFKIARGYAIFVLAAMLITMAGLAFDGKLGRFFTAAGQRAGSQDWAANNIFFFGAFALATVAFNAIAVLRKSGR